MSLIKKLAGQTAIYGLTTILARFINFFLTPIHLSGVLTMHEYGVLTSTYAYIAFLNVIFTYGMETAYFRFATKNENASQQVYNNAVTSILLSSLILAGGLYLFSNEIGALLGFPKDASVFKWVAFVLATDAIVAIPFARLRLLKKVYLFAGAKISNVILNYVLNFFFLIICPWIMEDDFLPFMKPFVSLFFVKENMIIYIFLANLLANVIYFPFLIPTFKGLNFKIDFKLFKEMFIYAFPILLTGIPGMVNEMFSRIMLEKWLPPNFYPGKTSMEALGIFGACYKMGVFMTLAIQAFRFASEPFFFSNAKEKNAPELFARIMLYFVLVTMGIVLFVTLNMDWIAAILIPQIAFQEGLYIVPVLLLSGMLFGIYMNLSVWYKLTDRTYWGTYITLGGAIITIVANYILIPIYGYHGSVWATLATYLCMTTISYIVGQKYFPVPYPIIKVGLYVAIGLAVLFCSKFMSVDGFNGFLIKNAVVLLYVFGLILVENNFAKKSL